MVLRLSAMYAWLSAIPTLFAITPPDTAGLGVYVFKVSKIRQSDARSLPQSTQAPTMEAFLPYPNNRLHGEVTLGSLAFSTDQYYKMRILLINIDASDETHAALEALKMLAVAPLKTLVLLRRGRESTYAKKEATWLGSPYVALHWNPNAEDAVEQIRAASHAVLTWMRRNRTAAYPYLPSREAEKVAGGSGAIAKKASMELFKSKKTMLDFSAEVLKGKPTKVRLLTENARIVQRINEHNNLRADMQSDPFAKLATELKSLNKNMSRMK